MKTATETLTKTEREIESESMTARVALHPFLAGMSETRLALLTECAISVHFPKGQTILREGEFANRFYLIESGKVALESDFCSRRFLGDTARARLTAQGRASHSEAATVVDTIGPGDPLGWSWMFPPYVCHFTARAVEPTEAIFFYGTVLRKYCERYPSLGSELFKRTAAIMLRRLQASRRKCSQFMRTLKTQTGQRPLAVHGQEQDAD
jgi:CRP/FNR family transcriptional regulator, cyclic AMP receptor protein